MTYRRAEWNTLNTHAASPWSQLGLKLIYLILLAFKIPSFDCSLYINTVHRFGVKTDLIFINPFVGSSEAVLLDGPAAEEDRPPRPPTSPEQLSEGSGDLHDDGRARWWINSSVAWNIDGRSLERQYCFHVPLTCFLIFSPDCAPGMIFSLYNYR